MKNRDTLAVADQYERFPFPKIPLLARPVAETAHPLSYELGQYLRTGLYIEHSRSTRILVAGSGTFEPLVLARVHPRATVVAVDLSANSLKTLRRRAWLSGLSSRLTTLQADLHDDLSKRLGTFDYIVSTGVIHHSSTPAALVASLNRLLAQTGVMRVMLYAAQSRLWIYELQKFFDHAGLRADDPGLERRCSALIKRLAPDNPLRTSFETYSDAWTRAGLVDGFFHTYDHPIAVGRLHEIVESAKLQLLGFGHAWHSQPNAFAAALAKAQAAPAVLDLFQKLNAWQRLAVLDDFRELAVNPVFWLGQAVPSVDERLPTRFVKNPVLARMRGSRRIPAPLAPTRAGELVARYCLNDLRGENQDFFEAGWLLGCDGALPASLLANRCGLGAERIEGRPQTQLQSQPAEQKIWAGLCAGVATLDPMGELASTPLVDLLCAVLEPREDFHGRELPGLSSGDVLRELRRSGVPDWEISVRLRGQPPTGRKFPSR